MYSIIIFDYTIYLEIVSDSLKMDNHCVWQITDCLSLLAITSFLTCIAHIVINGISSNVFVETIHYRGLIFDLQRDIKECVDSFADVSASHTGGSLGAFTSKYVIDQMLLGRVLQGSLDPIKSDIQKLLRIFLDPDICGLSIEFFETEAKWRRVVILSI